MLWHCRMKMIYSIGCRCVEFLRKQLAVCYIDASIYFELQIIRMHLYIRVYIQIYRYRGIIHSFIFMSVHIQTRIVQVCLTVSKPVLWAIRLRIRVIHIQSACMFGMFGMRIFNSTTASVCIYCTDTMRDI